ncbi:MAG: GatB/YqeY domain-containing protein [Pseudomonadales bacterium]|nr:GatB/YqeY domain-containing protein [Pseudomonadales bacterium]
MSDLKTRISEQTKVAMKARDKQRLAVLRLINSEIKKVEVDERRELSEPDILAILTRMLKQRRDSEAQFRDAKRQDLVDQEVFEIGVVEAFMPAQLGADEVVQLIEEIIKETGAASMQDMGKVMASLKAKIAGRADMGAASAKVKELLAG